VGGKGFKGAGDNWVQVHRDRRALQDLPFPPWTQDEQSEKIGVILYLKRQLTDYHVEHVAKSRTLHVFVSRLGVAAPESRERSDRNEGCGQ
jgi:hypothetical protein